MGIIQGYDRNDEQNIATLQRVTTVPAGHAGKKTYVNTNPSVEGSFLATGMTTSGSAVPIPLTPFADRKSISVYNAGANNFYIGGSNVDSSNGWPLVSGDSVELDIGPNCILYGIASASTNIRILEVS